MKKLANVYFYLAKGYDKLNRQQQIATIVLLSIVLFFIAYCIAYEKAGYDFYHIDYIKRWYGRNPFLPFDFWETRFIWFIYLILNSIIIIAGLKKSK